jgi:hypothetical protein
LGGKCKQKHATENEFVNYLKAGVTPSELVILTPNTSSLRLLCGPGIGVPSIFRQSLSGRAPQAGHLKLMAFVRAIDIRLSPDCAHG